MARSKQVCSRSTPGISPRRETVKSCPEISSREHITQKKAKFFSNLALFLCEHRRLPGIDKPYSVRSLTMRRAFLGVSSP